MPLNIATVSGYLTKPDGTALGEGVVAFTLSGGAASGQYITHAQGVEVFTDADGFFSVQLMPNGAYAYPTSYAVVGYEYDVIKERKVRGYDFGRIRVSSGAQDVTDVLAVQSQRRWSGVARLIQGETLIWRCTYVDDICAAVPVNLVDSIDVEFRHYSGAVELGVVDIVDPGNGIFSVTADTALWSVGSYDVSIRIEMTGFVKIQRGKLEVIA